MSETITLTSADGGEQSCRILQVLELEGREYALLLKLAGDAGEVDSTVLMQLVTKDGEAVFRTIEEDAEFERVTAYIREIAGESPWAQTHNPRLAQKWLACQNPCSLTFPIARFATLREWRLCIAAFARRVPPWQSDEQIRAGFELVERLADSLASEEQRLAALADAATMKKCWPLHVALEGSENIEELAEAAGVAASETGRYKEESQEQCNIIRDILGNPFLPMEFVESWRSWNGGAIQKLAASIYADPSLAEMSQLGDLLEQAGCTDRQILAHCRERGLHVRGCWLIDRLLGKRGTVEMEIIEPRWAEDWMADD